MVADVLERADFRSDSTEADIARAKRVLEDRLPRLSLC